MWSGVIFVVCVLVVAMAILFWKIGDVDDIMEYFDTDRGRKIRDGIVAFVGLGILAALIGMSRPADAESWGLFEYGEVYLGIDYTNRSPSPQCVTEPDGVDERLTSNGGVRVNLVQSPDKRFAANAKYTHHSCALNTDRNTYDGMGVELTYRIW